MRTKLLLAGIAALFLATGAAQATEHFVMRCGESLIEVFGCHGYHFSKYSETGDGSELSERLFRKRGNYTGPDGCCSSWTFRGRRCKYVKELLSYEEWYPEKDPNYSPWMYLHVQPE